MIWLITRPVVLTFKALFGTTKLTTKATSGSFKLGYRVGRLMGLRRLTMVAIGIGVGILIAPQTGAQSRAGLRRWFDDLVGTPSTTAPLLDARAAEEARDQLRVV